MYKGLMNMDDMASAENQKRIVKLEQVGISVVRSNTEELSSTKQNEDATKITNYRIFWVISRNINDC